MNYLILGKPFSRESQAYRGIHRVGPKRIEDTQVIRLWEWYSDINNTETYLHEGDLPKASELMTEYRKHGVNYELIRVSTHHEESTEDEFLGIDIATKGGTSILAWFFLTDDFDATSWRELPAVTELLFRYFRPRINRYVLLENKDDANFFSRIVKEMQTTNPAHFEYGDFFPQYLYPVTI